METIIYGGYILLWPALTLVMLIVICRGVWKDIKQARDEERDIL